MTIEVFNRHEKKYILNDMMFNMIKLRLEKHMEVDKHSKGNKLYTIHNIYYDTVDHAVIRNSIEKPMYKEKLRLRSYKISNYDDRVFLEVKKKFNGFVNKRRTTIGLNEAYTYINTGQRPDIKQYMNQQVLNETDYFIHRYKLLPMIYLSYDRYALFSKEEKTFRVTFDTNIRSRRSEVCLEKGNYGEPLLEPGVWIMEVKTEKAVPVWFARMLSEYKLYSSSFSKYGTEFKKNILNMNSQYITKVKVS